MDELIDDVLALARGGHKVIDATETSLDDIITAAWDTVESSDATLERVDTDARITGDQTRLQQLFENLFRNSVEHGSTCSRLGADDSVEHSNDPVTVRVGTLADGRAFPSRTTVPGTEDERRGDRARHHERRRDGLGWLSSPKSSTPRRPETVANEDGGVRFDVTGVQVD